MGRDGRAGVWLALLLAAVAVGAARGQAPTPGEPLPVGRTGTASAVAPLMVIPAPNLPQPPAAPVIVPAGPQFAAQAPDDDRPPTPPQTVIPPPAVPVDPPAAVTPAGCKTCAPLAIPGTMTTDLLAGGCATCGGADDCYPGRAACYPCEGKTRLGQFLCALYECACCPDPCYEPKWTPLADAGFYTAAPRPVTQTRVRGVLVRGFAVPDRAEYFWARADGRGKGPPPPGPSRGEPGLNYQQLSLYNEAASGKVSVFTDMPYLSISPAETPFAAGFGNLTVGTKTLLYDCELLQFAMQFATYIPTGNFRKGLGNGHVSLEPSLILGLKLAPTTYLQAQVAEWIPIGGDPDYMGSILHYHFSLNHVLCRPLPDVPVIAVFEVSGMSFQDGAYTDPVRGPFQRAGGDTYITLGPGLRTSVCDRIDFGFGSAFAVGNRLAPDQEYRIEVRVRY